MLDEDDEVFTARPVFPLKPVSDSPLVGATVFRPDGPPPNSVFNAEVIAWTNDGPICPSPIGKDFPDLG
jgi:hypothetical protein